MPSECHGLSKYRNWKENISQFGFRKSTRPKAFHLFLLVDIEQIYKWGLIETHLNFEEPELFLGHF